MRKAFLAVPLTLALAWFVWPGGGGESGDGVAEAPGVANQIWIERMPRDFQDKIDVLIAIEDEDAPFGVFARSSAYEGDYSAFQWSHAGENRIDVLMLQTDKRHRLTVKTRTGGCEPFDYCLKVKGAPRGSKSYGSMRDWVIEGAPEDALRAVRARLAATLARD